MGAYQQDYLRLATLYRQMRVSLQGERFLDQLPAKTEDLVRRQARVDGFGEISEPVRIDATTLDALKQRDGWSKPKVINLARRVIDTIRDQGQQSVLIPIGERVEDVLERLDDRLATTEEAMADIRRAVEEYVSAQKEREEMGVDARTFDFYSTLKQAGLELVSAREAAQSLEALFARFPEHVENAGQRRALKAELYRELLARAGERDIALIADRVMRIADK